MSIGLELGLQFSRVLLLCPGGFEFLCPLLDGVGRTRGSLLWRRHSLGRHRQQVRAGKAHRQNGDGEGNAGQPAAANGARVCMRGPRVQHRLRMGCLAALFRRGDRDGLP